MKLVIIESPYAAITETILKRNIRYLQAAMHDCLVNHHESPYASHGLYTQPGVLRDEDPEERRCGMLAGFAWRKVAEMTVVYTDLGISPGMKAGISHAEKHGVHVVYRTLPGWGK